MSSGAEIHSGRDSEHGPNAPVITQKAPITPADVHVLVVDDEILPRTLVSSLLRSANYTVTTAENGAQALAILRSHPRGTFHLVLTDVCMPEVNGIELLQSVKQDQALRSVPVVMMSSIDQGDTVFECVQRGAEEYLVKPVTKKEVQQMWQHVLKSRSAAVTVPQVGTAGGAVVDCEAAAAEVAPAVALPPTTTAPSAQPPVAVAVEPTAALVATRAFLQLMKDARKREAAALRRELQALDADAAAVEEIVRRRSAEAGSDAGTTLVSAGEGGRGEQDSAPGSDVNDDNGGRVGGRRAKRQRVQFNLDFDQQRQEQRQRHDASLCGSDSHHNNRDHGSSGGAEDSSLWEPKGWEQVKARAAHLEAVYAERRRASGDGPAHLQSLARDLDVLARGSELSVAASLRSGDIACPQEMVCCADFDADDSHFATVSISRCVKVYDFAASLNASSHNTTNYNNSNNNNITGANAATNTPLQFPVWQATTRSKLSSVSWSSYVRPHLLTADYDGLVQLWDVSTGHVGEAAQFDEHARRVWSLDFSRLDPLRFATGSDDSTVRLWSTNQDHSVAIMRSPANVCSVHFSPTDANLLAVGCANHKVYLYDLRRADAPAAVITGPTRAVSYVRFLEDGSSVVAASTDSTVRMYNIQDALNAHGASIIGRGNYNGVFAPQATTTASAATKESGRFTGHLNERNFVGLSVSSEGHIVTGSEDNVVHCYWKTLPFAIATHALDDTGSGDGDGSGSNSISAGGSLQQQQQKQSTKRGPHAAFVSSVAWARGGRHCLAANSQGVLRVLRLD